MHHWTAFTGHIHRALVIGTVVVAVVVVVVVVVVVIVADVVVEVEVEVVVLVLEVASVDFEVGAVVIGGVAADVVFEELVVYFGCPILKEILSGGIVDTGNKSRVTSSL